MSDYTKEHFDRLLEPFPPEAIGKLPKGGAMLDFVGHGHVRKRLCQVDPCWTWRPLSVDERGLPALDADSNLWIELTICGVTKPGVGDGKNMKERISDALRNSAMSFGVAVDLWLKESPAAEPEKPARPAPQMDTSYHGWASKEDHDRWKARVQSEGKSYGDAWSGWAKSQGLAWPCPLARRGEVEAKLEELRAASVVQDAFPEAEVVS